MKKVNIAAALEQINDHWRPRLAGDVNDCCVKLVKFAGSFDWHSHDAEDELFLVVEGTMRMKLRTGDIDVGPGEFLIVPHGTEHCPEALTETCSVMLIEPRTTVNTGNTVTDKTWTTLESIAG